jgi:diadenylate cyclase
MSSLFITIKFLDIVDILLVALLLYQFYMLIKGTVAINIFISIFSIYLFWLVVRALNMQLLASILGQIIGVGIIALIIVFQQEIRRFLLMLGTKYMSKQFSLINLLSSGRESFPEIKTKVIARACVNMSKSKTGALIVIARNSALQLYAETGEIINANTTTALIESIFFKNNPLHDGAIIVIGDKIFASKCMLPMSQNMEMPSKLGMRHRAGLGMTEHNDSMVIIVSEETGFVSIAEYGKLTINVTLKELLRKLDREFSNFRIPLPLKDN